MLKKTITYKDLDENDVTEDFYFNLTTAELAEWELSYQGGLREYLQQIIASKDGSAIINAFKDIIRKTVGKRSEDGKRFIKTEAIASEFMQTDAYSQLFIGLITDAKAASDFITAIVPAAMAAKVREQSFTIPEQPAETWTPPKLELPKTVTEDLRSAWERENREATTAELISMTDSEMNRYRQYLRHK